MLQKPLLEESSLLIQGEASGEAALVGEQPSLALGHTNASVTTAAVCCPEAPLHVIGLLLICTLPSRDCMKGEETENKKIGCTVNLMVRGHGPFLLLPSRVSSVLPCNWLGLSIVHSCKPMSLNQDIGSVTGILEICRSSVHFHLGMK